MSSPREDFRSQYENDIKEFYGVEVDSNNSYDDHDEVMTEGDNAEEGSYYDTGE